MLQRLRELWNWIRGRKTPPVPQGFNTAIGAATHEKHTSYITRKPLSIEEDTQEDFPLAEPTTTRKLGGLQGKEKSGSGDLAIGETSAFSPSNEDPEKKP